MKKSPVSMQAEQPGLNAPVKARSGPVRITAWLDTDRRGAGRTGPKTYFLDVGMTDWPSHELVGVSASRIKALGEAFLALHSQIANAKPAKAVRTKSPSK